MLQIAYSDYYHHLLPLGHRFPMRKYPLIVQQLIKEKIVTKECVFEPMADDLTHIEATHTAGYIEKLQLGKLSPLEIRKIGFPFSPRLIEREIKIMNGTVEAAKRALSFGIGFNVAGGTHHAFADRGEGFCLFNDIAVSANFLLNTHHLKRILVVDLDVHQGNETASIFWNNPKVFTFSIHGEKNYPLKKVKGDLDIGLPNYTKDITYLTVLKQALQSIIPHFKPDFIFYQSGVDILETDILGKMSVSINGCRMRDKIVLKTAYNNKIPLAVVMGGGYSSDIDTIVDAHCNTYRLANDIWF